MERSFNLVLVFAALLCNAFGQTGNYPYVLKTFAGSFPLGDGGPATQALLFYPDAVQIDAAGNVYVLDAANLAIRKFQVSGNISTLATTNGETCYDMKLGKDGNFYLTGYALVFKISPSGTVTTIAGTGVPGTSGDGGAATSAVLSAAPLGIALDAAGNVYFADGNRIREVTVADGIIHTVAGTVAGGAYNGDNQPAISANLSVPAGIAIDSSNNLYIADIEHYRVRKVTAATGIISTIAGSGKVGLPVNGTATASPMGELYGMALDSSNSVYVTDIAFNLILKIGVDGTLTKVAGGSAFTYNDGAATNIYLYGPVGIAFDGSGNLFIAEKNSSRVRELTTGSVKTVAGRLHYAGDGGPATSAILNTPGAVELDGQGGVFISDLANFRLRKVTPDSNINLVAGSGFPFFPAENAQAPSFTLPWIYQMATDAKGDLYFASASFGYTSSKILRITPAGIVSTVVGTGGYGDAGDGGLATKATFELATGFAMDASGNMYIADLVANRVRKVSATDGTISAFAGTGKVGYTGDGGLATSATVNFVGDPALAVDQTGNVYIVDRGNNVVRMVTPGGIISTVVGNGTAGNPTDGAAAKAGPFNTPGGVAVDSSGGLYVTSGNYNIYRVDSSGALHVISGGGKAALADGVGANSSVGFNAGGMRVDANGDVYVADPGNNRIRQLILNSPGALAISQGNNQTAPAGSVLPTPLEVVLNGRGGIGVAGATVNFAVTTGSATLSAASTMTDSTGTAGVAVTLGSTAGSVVVTATVAGSNLPSVQFTLTATAVNSVGATITSVNTSGASASAGISQNSWTEIHGTNLVPAATAAAGMNWDAAASFAQQMMPTQVGGVSVTVNDKPAYVYFFCSAATDPGCPSDQVNVLSPLDNTTGPVQIVVTSGTPSSSPFTATLNASAPSFFQFGQGYVVATHTNGNLLGPTTLYPGFSTPAAPGEAVFVWGTGFGLPSKALAAGASAQSGTLAVMPVCMVGTDTVSVAFAGLISPGLFVIDVVIPKTATPGDKSISCTYNGATSPGGNLITVGSPAP